MACRIYLLNREAVGLVDDLSLLELDELIALGVGDQYLLRVLQQLAVPSGRVGAARLSAMAVSEEAPASLGDASGSC